MSRDPHSERRRARPVEPVEPVEPREAEARHTSDGDLDHHLRRVLEPDPATVERLVQRALRATATLEPSVPAEDPRAGIPDDRDRSDGPPSPTPLRRPAARWGVAALAASALLAVLLGWIGARNGLHPQTPRPEHDFVARGAGHDADAGGTDQGGVGQGGAVEGGADSGGRPRSSRLTIRGQGEEVVVSHRGGSQWVVRPPPS